MKDNLMHVILKVISRVIIPSLSKRIVNSLGILSE